jgi:hypothetical protein
MEPGVEPGVETSAVFRLHLSLELEVAQGRNRASLEKTLSIN